MTNILHSYRIGVEARTVDIFKPLELAKHVSRISVKKKRKGNQVLVYMSSGNKLASGVASITAMAHNVKAITLSLMAIALPKKKREFVYDVQQVLFGFSLWRQIYLLLQLIITESDTVT